ncbi:hypothetical protein P9112_009239 [Eukaryota sp. TZLM1-RC]
MSRTHQQQAAQYKNYALHNVKDATFLDTIGTSSSNVCQTIKCSLQDSLVVIKIRFYKAEDFDHVKRHQEYLESLKSVFRNSPSPRSPNLLTISDIIVQPPEQLTNRTQSRLYRLYLVRPYVSTTLLSVLKTPFAVTFTERCWIAFQLTSCLAHIHSFSSPKGQKYVHGHVRPENVMLTSSYWALLTDAGAKPSNLIDSDLHYHRFFDTGPGVYVAPERFQSQSNHSNNDVSNNSNSQQYSSNSDVFSLGLLLIDIFTISSSSPYTPLFTLRELKGYSTCQEEIKTRAAEKLGKIEGLSKFLTDLIVDCFDYDPLKRPDARTLSNAIGSVFPFFPTYYSLLSENVCEKNMKTSDFAKTLIDAVNSNNWNGNNSYVLLLILNILPLVSHNSNTIDFKLKNSLYKVLIELISKSILPFEFLSCRVLSELINNLKTEFSSIPGTENNSTCLKSTISEAISVLIKKIIILKDLDVNMLFSIVCRFVIPMFCSLTCRSTSTSSANISLQSESIIFVISCLVDVIDCLMEVGESKSVTNDCLTEVDYARTVVFDMLKKYLNLAEVEINQSFDFVLQSILIERSLSTFSKFFFTFGLDSSNFDPCEYLNLFVSNAMNFSKSDLLSSQTRALFVSSVVICFEQVLSKINEVYDVYELIFSTLGVFIHDFETSVSLEACVALNKTLSLISNQPDQSLTAMVTSFSQKQILPLLHHPNPLIRRNCVDFITKIYQKIGTVESFCFLLPSLQEFVDFPLISLTKTILNSISMENCLSISLYNAALEVLESGTVPKSVKDGNDVSFFINNIDVFSEALIDHKISPTTFTKKTIDLHKRSANLMAILTSHLLEHVASKNRINQIRSSQSNPSVKQSTNLSTLTYSKIDSKVTPKTLPSSPFDSIPALLDLTPSVLGTSTGISIGVKSKPVVVEDSLELVIGLMEHDKVLGVYGPKEDYLISCLSSGTKIWRFSEDFKSNVPSKPESFFFKHDESKFQSSYLLSSSPVKLAMVDAHQSILIGDLTAHGDFSVRPVNYSGTKVKNYRESGLIIANSNTITIIDQSQLTVKPLLVKIPCQFGGIKDFIVDPQNGRWLFVFTIFGIGCLFDLRFPNGLLVSAWIVNNGRFSNFEHFSPSTGLSSILTCDDSSDRLVSCIFNNSKFCIISVENGQIFGNVDTNNSFELPNIEQLNAQELSTNYSIVDNLFSNPISNSISPSIVKTFYSNVSDKLLTVHSNSGILEWTLAKEPLLLNKTTGSNFHVDYEQDQNRSIWSAEVRSDCNQYVFDDVTVDSTLGCISGRRGVINAHRSGMITVFL